MEVWKSRVQGFGILGFRLGIRKCRARKSTEREREGERERARERRERERGRE